MRDVLPIRSFPLRDALQLRDGAWRLCHDGRQQFAMLYGLLGHVVLVGLS